MFNFSLGKSFKLTNVPKLKNITPWRAASKNVCRF